MLAFGFGHTELIVILIVALLLFGRRLPEVMRNLGKGIVEFKRGVRGIEDQVEEESMKSAPAPEPSPAVNSAQPATEANPSPSPQPADKKET
jgi:sec-independent protein translocase protein TatA